MSIEGAFEVARSGEQVEEDARLGAEGGPVDERSEHDVARRSAAERQCHGVGSDRQIRHRGRGFLSAPCPEKKRSKSRRKGPDEDLVCSAYG